MPKKLAAKPRARYADDAIAVAGRHRSQHATIRRYLEALAGREDGRQNRTPNTERLEARLRVVMVELTASKGLDRVQLAQERIDLEARLMAQYRGESDQEFREVEAAFVAEAADWARRKGISYAALRAAGVPAATLARAGIRRSNST